MGSDWASDGTQGLVLLKTQWTDATGYQFTLTDFP